MTSQAIHFGTSGWRGIIAEDFTFPGVRRASAAIAGHVLAQRKSPTLIVGYDTRFFSAEFALAAAAVLRSHGCRDVPVRRTDADPRDRSRHSFTENSTAA